MSVQAVNSVNNIQQKPVQSPIEPKKSEQKESIANGTTLLLGSLAALAVGAGIYFATKGRGGKGSVSGTTTVTNNNPVVSEQSNKIKNIKEKIVKLKQTIRENYTNKKHEIDNNAEFPNAYCYDYLNGKVTSSKDYDKLIRHLKEDKVNDVEKLGEMTSFVRSYRNKLNAKVKVLYQNSDWQLLRKLRRTKSDDQDIIAIKYWLVDDLLYSKANGTTSEFLKTLGLSVEDAMQMVREPKGAYKKLSVIKESIIGKHTPEGAAEYSKRYQDFDNKRINYGWKLSIKDLFVDLSNDAQIVEKMLPKLKARLELIEKIEQNKKSYKTEIENLANIFKQSSKVKELKDAIAELSKLE